MHVLFFRYPKFTFATRCTKFIKITHNVNIQKAYYIKQVFINTDAWYGTRSSKNEYIEGKLVKENGELVLTDNKAVYLGSNWERLEQPAIDDHSWRTAQWITDDTPSANPLNRLE